MAVAKVILNGNTLIDVTDKTVTSSNLVSPNTALGADGTTVTGALVTKSASDVTVSGATTTIPAGVYSSQVQKTVSSGSATTPATTITANPTISVSSSGLITASVSGSQSVTPTVSAGYVSTGTAGTITVSGSNTSQLTTQAAQTITPTTTNQTISSGRYLTGDQTILGDTNLVASNIMSGVSIFGVTGTLEPGGNLDSITINTSTFTSQSTTIEDGLVDVEDFSGKTMYPSGNWEILGLRNNFINFSRPNKYKFVGVFTMQWTNGDTETYTINSNYIDVWAASTVITIPFTWSSPNHSQSFSSLGFAYYTSDNRIDLIFIKADSSVGVPALISPSTLSVYCETDGYESITINLADDPRFTNINRSLYARSFIYDSMPGISEWCDSFSSINTLQFAGQMFIGSFTFNNVAYISEAAFISDNAATLWNVSSGYFNFPSCSLINKKAFAGNYKNIVGITANNCSIISDAAFSGCYSLNNISFPNCITISTSAFQNCTSLTTASFPVCSSIGSYAFSICTNLTTASFPECTSIGAGAFASCGKLTNIYFPKCTSIGNNAFNYIQGPGFTSVNFPSCTTIGTQAFMYCLKLQSISFPECTTIGNSAFYGCSSLSTISFPECTTIGGSAFFGCSSLSNVSFPECTSIGGSAFYYCSNLQNVSFPKCEIISSNAFYSCYSLTSINLPECTSLSNTVFYNCIGLTNISLPKCTFLGNTVFYSCTNLPIISLPKISSIGAQAFQYCKSLSSAYFMGSSIATAGYEIFYNTPIAFSSFLGYFGSIYVPASLLASYKTATNWTQYSSRMVGI